MQMMRILGLTGLGDQHQQHDLSVLQAQILGTVAYPMAIACSILMDGGTIPSAFLRFLGYLYNNLCLGDHHLGYMARFECAGLC